MIRQIIVAFFIIVLPIIANNNWEIAYQMKNYDLKYIKAFSKDTFLLATYYNMQRNGNITFENALWITTDIGNTWNIIYQDSTSPNDIPRLSQKILDIDVSENSTISFLREDGYILFSKNYGISWDSVKTSYEKISFGDIDSYGNNLAARFASSDTLYFLNLNTKQLTAVQIPLPNYKDIQNNTLKLMDFSMIDENSIIFSIRRRFPDSLGYSMVSEDKGKTWKVYEHRNIVFDYYFVNSNLWYSCGFVNLINATGSYTSYPSFDRTTDGGKTWENIYIGEKEGGFTDMDRNKNSFIYLTSYQVNPVSTNNTIEWYVDSIATSFVTGGHSLEIACDDYGNCLIIQEHNFIHRMKNLNTNVEESNTILKQYYNHSDYYDLQGNRLEHIGNQSDLNNGFYLKVYKDRNNKVIKTEKLIIIK